MTNKNINVLMDSELDQVAGGTLAETTEFINAYLNFSKRHGSLPQQAIDVIKAMPIEDQANVFMAAIAKGGGLASLRVDAVHNKYMVNGESISHGKYINFLNTH